jgi:preprotein translocase subunit SecG
MGFLSALVSVLMALVSIFLVLLVLVQRGRGGGLIGALGGPGGSSAFGTRAGDIFTRITIVTASIWFLLAIIMVHMYGGASVRYEGPAPVAGPTGQTSETQPSSGPGLLPESKTPPASPEEAAAPKQAEPSAAGGQPAEGR